MFCLAPMRYVCMLWLLVTRVVSLAWNVSASNLVRQLWMSTIVVDNWLFIEGGEYYVTGAASYSDLLNPPTRSIDLSKSWSTSILTINQIPKPLAISQVLHPGLFYQQSTNTILTFGEDSYYISSNYAIIWGLNIGPTPNGDSSWSNIHATTDPLWQSVTWPRQPSFAYTPTGGYALGGHTAPGGGVFNAYMLLEMTVVKTTTGFFERESDVGAFSTTGGVDQADRHYVSAFGGLLLFLGGVAYGTDTTTAALRSMLEINIYDLKTKKWYIQNASGDVPAARKNFCITGAQGTHGSTYEIFVYGGCGLDYFSVANADSRNVYILTLLAVRWIKIVATTLPRSEPSCGTVKNQMISYGGWDPTSAASYAKQEPWNYGIGISDLTKLTSGFDYDANFDAYVQSESVNKFYASNSLYPVWDNKSLGALFATLTDTSKKSRTTGSSSPTGSNLQADTTSTAPSTSPPSTPSSASKIPVAAIAGGVVGGIAPFAALIFTIWFLRSRPREKKEQDTNNHGVAELHGHHTYPELSTERTTELHGVSQTPYAYYQKDGQKTNALPASGPYEVHS